MPLIPGKCMYIVSQDFEMDGTPLALRVDEKPMYEGWEIFNTDVSKYHGPTSNNKS